KSQYTSLIAEIKQKSPSVGPMLPQNVANALQVYANHPQVHAISILTNSYYFGGCVEDLLNARISQRKPLLRKDFIISEYQILEARAFGADCILLMASVLDQSRLRGFFNLAREYNMQALFEIHEESEIKSLPSDATIIGINSRRFRSNHGFSGPDSFSEKDFSIHLDAFELVEKLPQSSIKVAESGISTQNLKLVVSRFNALLVGTSFLRDPRGIQVAVDEFARELQNLQFSNP
ncbi:MAG: indole-3-glycerol-phosphate synthase, partial [Chthoniobacterales bacterium]|nr:indole-3-glycerol-phosphate synthase [Chthoniobacterales bacterium]